MSVTPSIKLVGYEDRVGGFVFVAVPDERGRYVRTDRSVALVPCPLCRSIKGEPCKLSQGYSGGTHAARRTAAGKYKGRQDDVIHSPVDRTPILDGALALLAEPREIGSSHA